ncbi:mitochondrial antiviral-signaling protein-like isoform X3 [Xenopus laevis]|uniref:Mitochondrial antiviral-signaling protein n=1 Tax=Xenopus laevis TaxID=8355 RepID=A0A8J1M2N6_XENLA|nr:mitochondrial antiviral-signaling protein-like isoform X3 [Xenopus laevis]
MGFAEDKLKDYLFANIRSLYIITLEEILSHLPCLTTATQEQLRQTSQHRGNQNAIWEFMNALTKRDGWAGELLNALRECKHYGLATQLEEEYNKHVIKRPSQQYPSASGRNGLTNADIDNGNNQQPASLPRAEALPMPSHDNSSVNSRIDSNRLQLQSNYLPADTTLLPHQQHQTLPPQYNIQPPANPLPPLRPLKEIQPHPQIRIDLPQIQQETVPLAHTEAETPQFHPSYSSTDSMASIHSDVPSSSSSSSSSLQQNYSIENSVKTPIPETFPYDTIDPLNEVTKSPVQISSVSAASYDPCPPMSTPNKTFSSVTPGDYLKTQVSDSPPLNATSSPSALNLDRPLSSTPRDPDVRQKQPQRTTNSPDAIHSASAASHNDVIRVSNNRPLNTASPPAARNSDHTLTSTPREPYVQLVSPLNSTSSSSSQNLDQPLVSTPREPDVRQKNFQSPRGLPDTILDSASDASCRDVSRVAENPGVPVSSVRPLNRPDNGNEEDMVLSKPGELVFLLENQNTQAGVSAVTESLSFNHDFLFSSESSQNLQISRSLERNLQRTQDINANRRDFEGQPAQSQRDSYQSQLNSPSSRGDNGRDASTTIRVQPEENDMPYGNSLGSRNDAYNLPYVHNHWLRQTSQQPEETSDAENTDVRNFSITVRKDASLDLMAPNTNAPLKRMPSPARGPQPEHSGNSQDLGKVSKETDRDSKLLLTALAVVGVSLTLLLLWRRVRK